MPAAIPRGGAGLLSSAFRRRRLIEFSYICEPAPAGPIIGSFDGRPIYEFLSDRLGHLFAFEGAAPRHRNGQFNADALREGEFITRPGLIYRRLGVAQVSMRPGPTPRDFGGAWRRLER